MELSELNAGERVCTVDGNLVVVLDPSDDGRWIRVRYVANPSTPELVGTEDLCSSEELEQTLGNASATRRVKDGEVEG